MTTDTTPTNTDTSLPANAPRNPWLAGLLSLIVTGLGQVYNGQLVKGIAFMAVGTALGAGFWLMLGDPASALIGVSILLTINVLVVADAVVIARRRKVYTPGRANRLPVYLLVVVLDLGLGLGMQGIMARLHTPYQIPSASMAPTLLVGDRIMGEPLEPADPIARGDVVIFTLPRDPDMRMVKRVVGLPGETVSIKKRVVSVNGAVLAEPYAKKSLPDDPARDDMPKLLLGKDEYFVMGDNRDNSVDSRSFGPVRRAWMESVATYVIFPAVGPDFGKRWGMELTWLTRIPEL